MDRLVDHLFIFEGEGKIKDYNGNYTEYRELKKIEDREQKKQSSNGNGQSASTPSVQMASNALDTRKANDNERKEFKRLEKEIEKLEQQKAEITDKFNDSNISNKDIEKLSLELSGVLKQLEIKEMRWLELSELV